MSHLETIPAFPTFAGELPIAMPEYEAAVLEQSEQSSRFKVALGGILLSGLAFLGLEASTAPAAEAKPAAPSCYGDYCSGKYAGDTGCDKDAKTLDTATVTAVDYEASVGVPSGLTYEPFTSVKVGTIELRWSQKCKTAWARYNGTRASGVSSISVTQDTGYKQSRNIGGLRLGTLRQGSPANTAHTAMIYTPNNRVRASADGKNLLEMSTDWTK